MNKTCLCLFSRWSEDFSCQCTRFTKKLLLCQIFVKYWFSQQNNAFSCQYKLCHNVLCKSWLKLWYFSRKFLVFWNFGSPCMIFWKLHHTLGKTYNYNTLKSHSCTVKMCNLGVKMNMLTNVLMNSEILIYLKENLLMK